MKTGIIAGYVEDHTSTVQHRVIGPADGREIVGRDRRQRRRSICGMDAMEVEIELR